MRFTTSLLDDHEAAKLSVCHMILLFFTYVRKECKANSTASISLSVELAITSVSEKFLYAILTAPSIAMWAAKPVLLASEYALRGGIYTFEKYFVSKRRVRQWPHPNWTY